MTRRVILALLMLLAAPAMAAPSGVPNVAAGRIVDLGVLTSAYADRRRVVVWLPSTYRDGSPPHAVLYMHDGQNLFDKATAGYGAEWQIDEILDRLILGGQAKPTIVVGIWNTPKRLREYVPSKAFAKLPPDTMDRVRGLYGGVPLSDGYLKFLVTELKPLIDCSFNVRRDRANTAIMGSSMGGLISLYAINEYAHVFGSAGMVSSHWPLFLPEPNRKRSDEELNVVASAFEAYLAPALPDPRTHRLYFDHGSEALDAHYATYQERIGRVVEARGYRAGTNWITRNFPGHEHNENSWASRVDVPLRFLLPPDRESRR